MSWNTIIQFINETEQRLSSTEKLRQMNYNAKVTRPDDSYFRCLDSSLKKNTSFIRKLKTFSASQLNSILEEMLTLNLTKYTSEVASALVESKLKMTDITSAVKLCTVLHHKYVDFQYNLLDCWHRALHITEENLSLNESKGKVDLRFYAELINVGIFTYDDGFPLLENVLSVIMNTDRDCHNNINIVLTFCRYCGHDFAGLVSRSIRKLAETYNKTVPKSRVIPEDKQNYMKSLFKKYHVLLCRRLLRENREVVRLVRENKRILQTRGEVSAERRERGLTLLLSFKKLHKNCLELAEYLDEEIPQFLQGELSKLEELNLSIENGTSNVGEAVSPDVWDDEEMQQFYENLPNIRDFIQSPTDPLNEPKANKQEKITEKDIVESDSDNDVECFSQEINDFDEIDSPLSADIKTQLESFLNHLPQCVNREMIDNSAVNFAITFISKNHRKKLARTLYNVSRTRLDLLPLYARLVAILEPAMPEIAEELGKLLKHEFKFHVKKKDQINIETKIKVVRFIGELVKFRVFSYIEVLQCFKRLLNNFTHHQIEMFCNLLETCGRFLFKHPDYSSLIRVYIDQMMRVKSATILDPHYVTMIENAYYHVLPPERPIHMKKKRPPMHEFIRKLLFEDLMKSNVSTILRLMRKLNWKSKELASYAVKCLTCAFKVKYDNIRPLADLVSGIANYQDFVGVQVVDGVMEDIRLGMEVNRQEDSQRRLSMVKYLGELYNYCLLDNGDIFNVLYSFITFGVSLGSPSSLDPPENLFRIKLACVLLETFGHYLDSKTGHKRLDFYFVFFQSYYWFKHSAACWDSKKAFPIEITYMFRDTLSSLRPKLRLYENYEESLIGVESLKAEFMNRLAYKNIETNHELEIIQEDISPGCLETKTSKENNFFFEIASEATSDESENKSSSEEISSKTTCGNINEIGAGEPSPPKSIKENSIDTLSSISNKNEETNANIKHKFKELATTNDKRGAQLVRIQSPQRYGSRNIVVKSVRRLSDAVRLGNH
uniref:MIF4G domain-containing protein n=1 Tax=Timema poppense TaxID=170557 RepID=A0A7R9DK02_TIMPO|nr:unnamed protein product [Timema poppensis]